MPPCLAAVIRLLACVVLLAAVAACGPEAFDPGTPCTQDGRFPGAYPALERTLPAEYAGRQADTVDSGRSCEPASLGTLAARGVEELRFAGAIWDIGSGAAVSYAVLEAEGLRTDWVAEFYEVGARAGRRVEEVTVSPIRLGEVRATRVDALNGESYQSVIVLPGADGQVTVVIVANPIREIQTREAHEAVVGDALAGAVPGLCCN